MNRIAPRDSFMYLGAIMKFTLSFAVLLVSAVGTPQDSTVEYPRLLDYRPGTFLIGSLFQVFLPLMNGKCSPLNPTGVRSLEAFRYAIDKINEMQIPPWNGALGYVAYDTCGPGAGSRPLTEIFLKLDLPYICQGNSPVKGSVVGITGPLTSQVSLAMSAKMGHCIPLISSLATTDQLTTSTSQYYDYFARTVPPDSYQAYGIHRMVRELGWRRIVVVYGETTVARRLQQKFHQLMQESDYDLCVTRTIQTLLGETAEQSRDVAKRVEGAIKEGAEAVVILTGSFSARKYLIAVNNTAPSSLIRKTPMLGSDGWIKSYYATNDLLPLLKGSIGFNLGSDPDIEFDRYMAAQTIDSTRNKWLQKLIAKQNNCFLSNAAPRCNGSEKLLQHSGGGSDLLLFSAIDLLARAIFGTCKSNCTTLNGPELMKQVLREKFNDSLSSFEFFNGTNGGAPRYNILQVRLLNGTLTWANVGRYEFISSETEVLELEPTAIQNIPGGKHISSPSCGPEYEPVWMKSECRFRCFKFFHVRSAFQLMFLALSLLGLLATIYMTISNYLQSIIPGEVPYTELLLNSAAAQLFLVSFLHVFAVNSWSCKVQKVLFAFGGTFGALALALKCQGTKRFTRFSCEWCGLFTRNLKMATLLQIAVVTAFEIAVAVTWIILDTNPLHRFSEDDNDYICCSFFQPYTTTYLYIIPLLLHSLTFVYSFFLYISEEVRWREEGRLHCFMSAFFVTLSVGFVTGMGVSDFKKTSFVGSGNIAVSFLTGHVFLMYQWFRLPASNNKKTVSQSTIDTEESEIRTTEGVDEDMEEEEQPENAEHQTNTEELASTIEASTSPSGYQVFRKAHEPQGHNALPSSQTGSPSPNISSAQINTLKLLVEGASRQIPADEGSMPVTDDSTEYGTVDTYVEKL